MNVDPITDFLLARISEVEDDPWRGAELIGSDRVIGAAEHAALMSDEREWEAQVFADCRAKREIVQQCARAIAKREGTHAAELALDVLRSLSDAFSDHPDFDPAWLL